MVTERFPIPGVGVAVINESRLLVVRKNQGPFADLWAVPGGKVELGETRREAAAREVLEETGLEVAVKEAIWIGESIGPGEPPEWHFTLVDFRAAVIGGTLRAGDDASEARWVTRPELTDLPVIPLMRELSTPLEKWF